MQKSRSTSSLPIFVVAHGQRGCEEALTNVSVHLAPGLSRAMKQKKQCNNDRIAEVNPKPMKSAQ